LRSSGRSSADRGDGLRRQDDSAADGAHGRIFLRVRALVHELATARIGETYNQYADSKLRRERLADYLEARAGAPILLVGEAAGYRGARVSGLPFTSERQLTGTGPAEATATIVQRVLAELGLTEDVLLWNVVPTHPGTASSNRAPSRAEIRASECFLERLAEGRRVVAVGRVAARVTGAPYVRHPSHGGAFAFTAGLLQSAAGARGAPLFCA
jgi:uracil DNA glycosylase superfamily protein